MRSSKTTGNQVPIAPYPQTESAFGYGEWSEGDREDVEELEAKEMFHDVEKMVVAEKQSEMELDETIYSDKMTVKELQHACKERQLPTSGS